MAWDRIKLMLRTCPSHGVNEWTILHSFYNGLNYMSRNILDSAAGGAFMGKTIVEVKNILERILQNYSKWHTDRAPSSSKKVNSVEETHDLSSKMDTILALLNKPNVENVPLQELVGNNSENVDVNFIRNYGNNGYGNNNYNSYNKPHMCQINMLLVVMFLVIWKTPLDILYLLKMSLIKNLSLSFKNKILCLKG